MMADRPDVGMVPVAAFATCKAQSTKREITFYTNVHPGSAHTSRHYASPLRIVQNSLVLESSFSSRLRSGASCPNFQETVDFLVLNPLVATFKWTDPIEYVRNDVDAFSRRDPGHAHWATGEYLSLLTSVS